MMELGLVVVVYACVPLSLVIWFVCLLSHSTGLSEGYHPVTPHKLLLTIGLPLLLAYRGVSNESLTVSGSLAAIVIGGVHTLINYSLLASLLSFYWLGSKATKLKISSKTFYGSNKSTKSTARNWIQVVCNGGVATQMTLFYYLEAGCRDLPIDYERHYAASWWAINAVTAIACCSGDTFASEIGPILPFSQPYLITTLRPVPKGTNGGVSLAGTVASAVGGLAVGCAFYFTLIFTVSADQLSVSPPQWPVLPISAAAGLIGSFIDSLLGASIQFSGWDRKTKSIVEHSGPSVSHISGISVLDNHTINFISSFFTTLVCSRLSFALWWRVALQDSLASNS